MFIACILFSSLINLHLPHCTSSHFIKYAHIHIWYYFAIYMFHKLFLSKRSYFIHFWYPKYIIFNVSLKYIYFPMKYLIPRFLEPRLTVLISRFRILKILHRNLQFVLWPLTCLRYMSLSNLLWIVHIERY